MNTNNQSMMGTLQKTWVVWFAAYAILGVYAMGEHRTSFLAQTVEHFDAMWIKLIFLNFTLQLALAAAAVLCWRASSAGAKKAGMGLAMITTVLIAIHLILSFVTTVS